MTPKNNQHGAAGLQAWIDGVKPEHQSLVKRIDALISEMIPNVRRTIKWRKPLQPLGVPYYGVPSQGWIVAMMSFKDRVGVGVARLHPHGTRDDGEGVCSGVGRVNTSS